MAFDYSLYEHNVGYYEFMPGRYLPGKMPLEGDLTWNKEAVDAAVNVDLDDSDILFATYPKTGMLQYYLKFKNACSALGEQCTILSTRGRNAPKFVLACFSCESTLEF